MDSVAAGGGRTGLEIIFVDWLDAIRRGDIDRLRARLAPDVVHQGVRADYACRGRDAVLARMRSRIAQPPQPGAIELIDAGDRVLLSVRAPTVGAPLEDDGPPRGQASIVFTLREGMIVRMQDFLSRADALTAIGQADDQLWQ